MTDDVAGDIDANDSASAADSVVPAIPAYDAVVYDLDGTLVDLAVDWGAVAEAVLDVYAERAIKPPTGELWGLLGAADEYGIRDSVEATITEYKRAGARDSTLLPLGRRLAEAGECARRGDGAEDRPAVGVCSLNSEAACRVAIETHGLGGALESDAVVGRDTAETYKPEPESLLAAVERLGATPDRALFVGDSERDAVTAERAGTGYAWVSELLD
ncbi:HAD family hydrolase [Halorubrum sp. SD626R]|uniref:HAD family hydrolase n=1 Tax=Halorubrum sp. SD626R TaxID=1419722 RepID=UPI0010F45DB2|nr:HAD-IA family hydrolase [Halorubrum sp. SD626R]TKX78970.1 HAD family hydrolase [Halorubrum sp. SD626R]